MDAVHQCVLYSAVRSKFLLYFWCFEHIFVCVKWHCCKCQIQIYCSQQAWQLCDFMRFIRRCCGQARSKNTDCWNEWIVWRWQNTTKWGTFLRTSPKPWLTWSSNVSTVCANVIYVSVVCKLLIATVYCSMFLSFLILRTTSSDRI